LKHATPPSRRIPSDFGPLRELNSSAKIAPKTGGKEFGNLPKWHIRKLLSAGGTSPPQFSISGALGGKYERGYNTRTQSELEQI